MTRGELIENLGVASALGRLGLFVGAGFSKAATGNAAPSWLELLEATAASLKLTFDAAQIPVGGSFPKIASTLVDDLVRARGCTRQQAAVDFKRAVGDNCRHLAAPKLKTRWAESLESAGAAWITTTNYDHVLEDLLADNALSLLPDHLFHIHPSFTPVFHMHGSRSAPQSIVITEEDYIGLFRPLDYRQLKLSMLLSESVTLILGYGLGDINVLHALDLARNVFSFQRKHALGESVIVQAVRDPAISKDPALHDTGLWVIGIEEIVDFLEEIGAARTAAQVRGEKDNKDAELIRSWLLSDPDAFSQKLSTDKAFLATFVNQLQPRSRLLRTSTALRFFELVLDKQWAKTQQAFAFSEYTTFLKFLVDIMEHVDPDKIHPSVFDALASRLEQVARYIESKGGPKYKGMAWDATNLWWERVPKLPVRVLEELRVYSRAYGSVWLDRVLP